MVLQVPVILSGVITLEKQGGVEGVAEMSEAVEPTTQGFHAFPGAAFLFLKQGGGGGRNVFQRSLIYQGMGEVGGVAEEARADFLLGGRH